MTKSSKETSATTENGAVFYGDPLPFPISKAVRTGDFVTTSAFGAYIATVDDQVYGADGTPLATGRIVKKYSFADEVHGTFKMVSDALALAGCSLEDVVDTQVWLKDPRDFAEMNAIYATYFKTNRPIRTVFQNHFMMEFRIEMKAVAYNPV